MAGTPKNSLKTGSTPWVLGISVLLFAATWIFGALLQGHADRAEHWYFLSVYHPFRNGWDATMARSPVPFIYVWIGLVVIYLAWLVRLLWNRRFIRLISLSILLIAIHLSWFYWTWGFNYHREALFSRWSLETNIRQEQFLNELAVQTRFIDSFRMQHAAEINVPEREPVLLEAQIRELLNRLNHLHGFPDFKGVRCRNLHPSGSLLIWSTSGVYLPFTGESQMDAGLHRLSKPFTMAHELAHGMGWTDEGECNFLAYLACSLSEDPYIRYAGELSYWRYLLAHAARYEPETFKQIRAGMHPEVFRDLSDIDAANNRYPELIPAFREWFYDWYLKTHGIASGDRSYSEIVRLVIAYRQRQSAPHQ